jgi:hypothetical protein
MRPAMRDDDTVLTAGIVTKNREIYGFAARFELC